jgi:hypothetical protein
MNPKVSFAIASFFSLCLVCHPERSEGSKEIGFFVAIAPQNDILSQPIHTNAALETVDGPDIIEQLHAPEGVLARLIL